MSPSLRNWSSDSFTETEENQESKIHTNFLFIAGGGDEI